MKIKLKTHSFSTAVAEEVGLLPAVLLYNIYYWVEHNEKNNMNFYDGYYWTYNSAKAFQEQFTYASVMQIRSALDKLKEAGYILTANYNKAPFDRTLWYTVTDKAISIMGGEDSSNYISPAGNTPAETTPVKKEKYKDEIKEIIDYLNTKTGCKYRYTTESTNKLIRSKLNAGFKVNDFKSVIDKKVLEWKGTEFEKYLRPYTLFGNKFEQYLNQLINNKFNSMHISNQTASTENTEHDFLKDNKGDLIIY